MDKREDIIVDKDAMGYQLIADTGDTLIFRKKINWLLMIFLFLLWIIPGVIYLIVHYNKPKLRYRYRKE